MESAAPRCRRRSVWRAAAAAAAVAATAGCAASALRALALPPSGFARGLAPGAVAQGRVARLRRSAEGSFSGAADTLSQMANDLDELLAMMSAPSSGAALNPEPAPAPP
ncbi:unnamed protein product, partial [Polarella glacialis]